MKHYFTFKEKKEIVEEAYSCVCNIKPTARKHDVSPAQIRRWKAKLAVILADSDISEEKKRHIMKLKHGLMSEPFDSGSKRFGSLSVSEKAHRTF